MYLFEFYNITLHCVFLMFFFFFFLFPQAGSDVRDETVPNLVQLIATATKLHCYTVHKLYRALISDISQVRMRHAVSVL